MSLSVSLFPSKDNKSCRAGPSPKAAGLVLLFLAYFGREKIALKCGKRQKYAGASGIQPASLRMEKENRKVFFFSSFLSKGVTSKAVEFGDGGS